MPGVQHWWVLYILFEIVAVCCVIGIAIYGFFRWDRRYHGAAGAMDQFMATPETFRDPTTQRMMRVYSNPNTGARQYREEPPGSG
jgi:hypothetical protein